MANPPSSYQCTKPLVVSLIYTFRNSTKERRGWKQDQQRIQSLCRQYNWCHIDRLDLTLDETFDLFDSEKLQEICDDISTFDCLFVMISTHGVAGEFTCNDGQSIKINDFIKTVDKLDQFQNKLKWISIQACQVSEPGKSKLDTNTSMDSSQYSISSPLPPELLHDFGVIVNPSQSLETAQREQFQREDHQSARTDQQQQPFPNNIINSNKVSGQESKEDKLLKARLAWSDLFGLVNDVPNYQMNTDDDDNSDDDDDDDTLPELTDRSDFLLLLATPPGFAATRRRDTRNWLEKLYIKFQSLFKNDEEDFELETSDAGSTFITSLWLVLKCSERVFERHLNVLQLATLVCRGTAEKDIQAYDSSTERPIIIKQMPIYVSTLSKLYYLTPSPNRLI